MERNKKISVTQQMGLDSLALIKTPQLIFHQRNFFEPLSSEGFVLERIFLEVEGSQIEDFLLQLTLDTGERTQEQNDGIRLGFELT
jgi:hypothetical protein